MPEPYVHLGRDIMEVLDGENYAQFGGEWEPMEPKGWETFGVYLHGEEAGEAVPATWEDLYRIIEARDA